jgi:hypothetical protein
MVLNQQIPLGRDVSMARAFISFLLRIVLEKLIQELFINDTL